MKKTIAIITAMLLLSACDQAGNNEFSETAQAEETILYMETTASEIAEADKTSISEIEPSVRSIDEASEPEEDTDPKNILRTIDLKAILGDRSGRFGYVGFFGSDTICAACCDDEMVYVLAIDIESGEAETIFSDSFRTHLCHSQTLSDGRLYASFENDRSLETLNVLINKDGSYESEISEYGKGYWDYDVNMPVYVGEHLVKNTSDGIIDAESGEVLIPTELNESGHRTESYELACVLDDDRFVYQKTKLYYDGTFYEGYDDGIGIYSFDTGTAADIPEAFENFRAAANGKIYSEGFDGSNYLSMTDIYTLETQILLGDNTHEGIRTFFRITFPDNCEFIGAEAYLGSHFGKSNSEYILIDPISGEIIRTLPEQFALNSSVVFYTENYICCRSFNDGMLYIVER